MDIFYFETEPAEKLPIVLIRRLKAQRPLRWTWNQWRTQKILGAWATIVVPVYTQINLYLLYAQPAIYPKLMFMVFFCTESLCRCCSQMSPGQCPRWPGAGSATAWNKAFGLVIIQSFLDFFGLQLDNGFFLLDRFQSNVLQLDWDLNSQSIPTTNHKI